MKTIAIKRPQELSGDTAVLALLAEIRDELRGLRADLAAGRPAQASTSDGREAVAELLRQIVAYCGDAAFSTRALVSHGTGVPALSAAIIGATGVLNARSVGKVLKTWEGADVGYLQVKRLGQDAAGVVWQVVEVLK